MMIGGSDELAFELLPLLRPSIDQALDRSTDRLTCCHCDRPQRCDSCDNGLSPRQSIRVHFDRSCIDRPFRQ